MGIETTNDVPWNSPLFDIVSNSSISLTGQTFCFEQVLMKTDAMILDSVI